MKKFLLLLVLLCPLIGWSQATTGYHRISRVLARAPQTVTAQVVPYAKINVAVASTGLAATIYSDPLLSVQITPPVVTADLNGNYDYYIPLSYMVTETISAPGQGSSVVANVGENGVNIVAGTFASPPPIGSVAPNTGAFTSLISASGALNGTLGAITPHTVNATSYSVSGVPLASSNLSDFVNLARYNFSGTFTALQNFNAGLTAQSVNGVVNAGQYLIADGVTDNCAAWGTLLAAVPTGATIYIPRGTYKVAQTCSSGFGLVWTKSLSIVGESSGWWDGSNVQGATLFIGGMNLATFPGSVKHIAVDCRTWTIACDGVATGTGGVIVDDIIYVGTYITYPAHAVLIQADVNNTLPNLVTNIRAYNAQHGVAIRARHTIVNSVQTWDTFDNITKANATEGDLYDVQWSNIASYSSTNKGAEFIIEADAGTTAYNITCDGMNFYNSPFGIVYSAQNGGGIRQVNCGTVNSYNSGTSVLTQVVSSGSIGAVGIANLNVFNATAANVVNNSGPGNLSISNLTINGTLVDPVNAMFPHNSVTTQIPAVDVWDGNSQTADLVTLNNDAEAAQWYRAPSGSNFFHGRILFSAVGCQGSPGWQFQNNTTAQGRGFPSMTYVACIDQLGQINTNTNVIAQGSYSNSHGVIIPSNLNGNTGAGTKLPTASTMGNSLPTCTDSSGTLNTTCGIPTVGTPVLTQAACFFAAGPPVQLGHCTTVVGATGACTCVFP